MLLDHFYLNFYGFPLLRWLLYDAFNQQKHQTIKWIPPKENCSNLKQYLNGYITQLIPVNPNQPLEIAE